jgi:hypothetical protein
MCGYDYSKIIHHTSYTYESVSESFRTGCMEQELQIIQLSATMCSCITILWVSLVSFTAITLCVASQWEFIVVYFVDSVRKLLDTPSYTHIWGYWGSEDSSQKSSGLWCSNHTVSKFQLMKLYKWSETKYIVCVCIKWNMISIYKGVSKSFRTGRLELELQMVQLSDTRCSCIAILWVSIVSFAAITLCVASQLVFVVVSIYFVINPVRKLLDTFSPVNYPGQQ